MKLIHTPKSKRTAGMTLLELTVVILVLLSLITILFVGARAWKKGSDRSANIMNIRNVQQAVRGHQNMRGLLAGVDCAKDVIFGDGVNTGYLKEPKPPVSTVTEYTYTGTIPEIGTLYISNGTSGDLADYAPDAATYADW